MTAILLNHSIFMLPTDFLENCSGFLLTLLNLHTCLWHCKNQFSGSNVITANVFRNDLRQYHTSASLRAVCGHSCDISCVMKMFLMVRQTIRDVVLIK